MGAPAASAALANRRAACSARAAEEALRALEEERRRGDALQEQVWVLQGLLAQSQSNHDALVRGSAQHWRASGADRLHALCPVSSRRSATRAQLRAAAAWAAAVCT